MTLTQIKRQEMDSQVGASSGLLEMQPQCIQHVWAYEWVPKLCWGGEHHSSSEPFPHSWGRYSVLKHVTGGTVPICCPHRECGNGMSPAPRQQQLVGEERGMKMKAGLSKDPLVP